MEHLPLDARSVLEELRSADASLAEALPRTWVPSASFDALVEEAERMPLALEEHLLWLHDNCDLAAALAPLEGSGLRGWAKRWAHRIVLAVMNPYLVKVQDCIVETVRALDEQARRVDEQARTQLRSIAAVRADLVDFARHVDERLEE